MEAIVRTASTSLSKGLLVAVLFCALVLPCKAAQEDELVFLHYWSGTLSGGIAEMTEVFNKSSDKYKVRATPFEHESFKVSIPVMLSGGNPPDLFSYWAGAKVEKLVRLNQLASIDDVWWRNDLDAVFGPGLSKACTYSGHKYALPVTQHAVGIFYNKAVFKAHNITTPRTFDELLEVCRVLKQAGVTPIALGARDCWPAQFWFDYLLLRTAGPDFRQQLMAGKVAYGSPQVRHAFKLWKAMLDEGFFNESPHILDWAGAAGLVHSGKAAMTLMGTWIIGLYDNQLKWEQITGYDYFPFPTVSDDVPLTTVGPIDAIVVPRDGRPEAVNSVLAFFARPGPQMEMSTGSGALAPSKAIPLDFYTPLQQRILGDIAKAPHWAFNYDLATPPEVADLGLDCLKLFLKAPESYETLLTGLDDLAAPHFTTLR